MRTNEDNKAETRSDCVTSLTGMNSDSADAEPRLSTVVYFDLGDTLIYGPSYDRRPYADAVDTLRTLYERGYLIGLLSNQADGTTVADVAARLVSYGFADYIETITISSEHPDGNIFKPDPRIFDLALQKVGHPTATGKTIFVTESASHIAAARDLGWRAILKRNVGRCLVTDGECVPSLNALLDILTGPRDITGDSIPYSPPSRIVDGLIAVPIEIQHLDASMTFNATTETCDVDATVEFLVGPMSGNPIFDLRQTIGNAWLDGTPFDVAKLAHHNFGGGIDSDLRVIESTLDAESIHTLRLTYRLALPAALISGSGSPTYQWNNGRLNLKFWYTDLRAGRYLDGWLPGNLIFNRFTSNLDIEIVNSGTVHTVITNGALTNSAPNHWQVSFPAHFSVCSGMLRIHPLDEITSRTASTTLPSGATVEIQTLKAAGDGTDLASQEALIETMLGTNETSTGPYSHGNRYIAVFDGLSGGMEYSGACKTVTAALEHEIFHSWWGRGVQPATQNDSWIDEAWAVYNTSFNRFAIDPFDMSALPITLCPSNPFNRITPNESYLSGFEFFAGLATVLGLNSLCSNMKLFYQENQLGLITTKQLEEYLICKSGMVEIADYFERFVYGFGAIGTTPELRINQLWSQQDNLSTRGWEKVEAGQDNWFYAEITNESATTVARALVVTFSFKSPFSTPVYPGDFRNSIIGATVEFNLAPGEIRTVSARWPKESIPPIPTGADVRHGCILAEIYNPEDHVSAGVTSIGASNGKLKQRNTDIVNLLPDEVTDYFFDLSSLWVVKEELVRLEVIRPPRLNNLEISFHHRNPFIVKQLKKNVNLFTAKALRSVEAVTAAPTEVRTFDAVNVSVRRGSKPPLTLHLAGGSSIMVPSQPLSEKDPSGGIDEQFARYDADLDDSEGRAVLRLRPGHRTGFPYVMKPRDRTRMRVKIKAPKDSKPGDQFTVEVVTRNRRGEVLGGFDILINIVDKK